MSDICMVYLFKDVTESAQVVPNWIDILETMPMFDELAYNTTATAIETSLRSGVLPIKMWGGQINYRCKAWIMVNSDDSTRIELFPNADHAYYTDGNSWKPVPLKTVCMYKAISENASGFWFDDINRTVTWHPKLFMVKVIDELTNTTDIMPVFSRNVGYNNSDNICNIYPYSNLKVDVKNIKIKNAEPGMSNTFVMRQLRWQNYLCPDVYIISGGLFFSDREIITIDNNTYIHMCNDIYLKLS